ncbi:hypothetical protein ACHAXT_004636 [Thalassiosira profunda]
MSVQHRRRDEGDIVTVKLISLVFALAIGTIVCLGFGMRWPIKVVCFDLLLVISGSGVVIYLFR